MNEIDFARGCRAVRTGDLVVFSDDDAATVDPEEADAVGFAVRFVDPTKPLLLFRTREERRTGFRIDFFQDVLYGTGSPIRARRFSVWRPVAAGGSNVRGNTEDPPQVVRWRQRIAVAIGCPLDTETELFDAYATGALSGHYIDAGTESSSLSHWASLHLASLGWNLDDLTPVWAWTSIWDGHDVYAFS